MYEGVLPGLLQVVTGIFLILYMHLSAYIHENSYHKGDQNEYKGQRRD